MRGHGMDLDIGYPNMTREVSVESFAEVTSKIKETTTQVEEATEELKKITLGTSLIADVDLNEQV